MFNNRRASTAPLYQIRLLMAFNKTILTKQMLATVILILKSIALTKCDTASVSSLCHGSKVYWTVASKTDIFGKDVKLVCKTTDGKDFCSNCTKIWTGGPEHSLLSLNGFPTENSKYRPTMEKNAFQIEIKNFNETDLNENYTCFIGINFCTRNLTYMFIDVLKDIPQHTGNLEESDSKTAEILGIVLGIAAVLIVIFVFVILCKKTKMRIFCNGESGGHTVEENEEGMPLANTYYGIIVNQQPNGDKISVICKETNGFGNHQSNGECEIAGDLLNQSQSKQEKVLQDDGMIENTPQVHHSNHNSLEIQ